MSDAREHYWLTDSRRVAHNAIGPRTVHWFYQDFYCTTLSDGFGGDNWAMDDRSCSVFPHFPFRTTSPRVTSSKDDQEIT